MKAMIFAAGLGTRLKPYTDTMPKALVPVAGEPMLGILIRHLIKNGISEILINVHHFASQILNYLNTNNNFGISIVVSDESDQLLDTGGGLKKAAWFFDDNKPFLVHNVDVMSDIKLKEMLGFHERNSASVTLAVSRRESSRYFLFDSKMQLCGWENTKNNDIRIAGSTTEHLSRFAFSGIHIIDPEFLNLILQAGRFSIVDAYLELAASVKISGFEHSADGWIDMGKPDEITRASDMILLNKQK